MTNRELKNLLKDSLDMEQELYEFCLECIEKLYPEQKEYAKAVFEEGCEGYQYNGCIQPLHSIDLQIIKNASDIKKASENLQKNADAE